MAELPSIENKIAEIHAPQQVRGVSVTRAEIEAPYRQLSLDLKELGKVAGDVAKPLATEAGHRAVTQDADGNVHVDAVPIIGEAANDYHRAVVAGGVAKVNEVSKRDLITLRQKFADDPQGFITALDEYREKKKEQYDSILGPSAAQSIGRTIDQTGTMLYRGLANQKRRADVKEGGNAIVGQANSYADDLVSLAEAGGTGSAEYKDRLGDYDASLSEAADNPLINFSRAQADAHRETTVTRARQAAFIGGVRSTYQNEGADGAQAFADEMLDGPDGAHWSPTERAALATRSRAAIDALDAKQWRDITEGKRLQSAARESREHEGFASAALGSLNQSWLDRHGDEVGTAAREQLQQAIYAPGGQSNDPAVASELTRAALTDPASAARDGTAALISGQITKGAFEGLGKLALQVTQDQASRPWANDLRRDVLTRQPAALDAVNSALSSPSIAPADARKMTDELVDQYTTADRRRLAATLPLPMFSTAGRGQIEAKDIDEAHQRTVAAARAGETSLADIASQADLLSQWRHAVAKEA